MPSLFDPDNPMFLRKELRPYPIAWMICAAGIAIAYLRHKNLYGEDQVTQWLHWAMLAGWAPIMLLGLVMYGRRQQQSLERHPSAGVEDEKADKLQWKGFALVLLAVGLGFVITQIFGAGTDEATGLGLGLSIPLLIVGFGIVMYAGFVKSSVRSLDPDLAPDEVEEKIQNVKLLSRFLMGCAPVVLLAVGFGLAALLYPSFGEINRWLLVVIVAGPIVVWTVTKRYLQSRKSAKHLFPFTKGKSGK